MNARYKARFDAGAEALRQHFPDHYPVYACPLCLRGFTPDNMEDLSNEHVPAKALGGKVLVLTCKDCNGGAGGPDGVDTHAKAEENLEEFASGGPRAHPVKVTAGGVTIRAEVERFRSGSLCILGLPKSNHPADLKAFSIATPDGTIHFDINFYRYRFSSECATVSWIRAAYLAVFAQFGYRYIIRRLLDPIRALIKNPLGSNADQFRFIIPNVEKEVRGFYLVAHPQWVKGLAVQMGPNLILLPFSDHDWDFYDRLRNNFEPGKEIKFAGNVAWRWPTRPLYLLDFDQK